MHYAWVELGWLGPPRDVQHPIPCAVQHPVLCCAVPPTCVVELRLLPVLVGGAVSAGRGTSMAKSSMPSTSAPSMAGVMSMVSLGHSTAQHSAQSTHEHRWAKHSTAQHSAHSTVHR